jgi:spore germination protein YaaH
VANADLFTEASPFWYTAKWSGGSSISELVSSGTKSTVLGQLSAAGVKVVPTVTDSMPTRQMAAVMADPALRATLVAQLVSLVTSNGYAGIDLDFEKFAFDDGQASWPTTNPAWVAFIAALSSGLHAQGRILAVTTPPIYNASKASGAGYWVYDWAAISPYVDRLRIMAYDYSVSVPGPIAPFAWVEKIVAFAVSQVASGKVQIGVASYGRDWVQRTTDKNVPTYPYRSTGTCPVDNKPSFDKAEFSASSAASVLASRSVSPSAVRFDAATQEMTFTYSKTYTGVDAKAQPATCTVYHEGWYDEARAATARAGLVGKYHLAGIAEWTVGGEDPAQWSALRAYASSIAPTPTTVSVTAPRYVGFRQPLYVTSTALSAGLPVVGATATLFFRKLGTSAWVKVAAAPTSSTGWVRFLTALPWHGDYRVYVSGTYDRASGAGQATVTARSVLAVTPAAASVRAGSSVTLVVRVSPSMRGQVVLAQMRSRGHWVSAGTTVTSRKGVATFVVKPPGRRLTTSVRIIALAKSGWATGTSYAAVRAR